MAKEGSGCCISQIFSSVVSREPSFAPGYHWLQLFLFCFMYGISSDCEKGCTRWLTFPVACLDIWESQTSQRRPRVFGAPSCHHLILCHLSPSAIPFLIGCLKKIDPMIHFRRFVLKNASHPQLSLKDLICLRLAIMIEFQRESPRQGRNMKNLAST